MVLDIVFSLDSVITAVGMVDELGDHGRGRSCIAVGVMLVVVEADQRLRRTAPELKILALAFLILIGVMLVAEGFGQHIPKGYIYFAMAFSLGVELLNMRYSHAAPAAGRRCAATCSRDWRSPGWSCCSRSPRCSAWCGWAAIP